jgi:hypothetical protein
VAVQGSHLLAVWSGECNLHVGAKVSRDGGVTWQDASGIPWAYTHYSPAAMCAGDSGRFYLVAPVIDIGGGQGRTMEAHEGRFVGNSFVWRRLAGPVLLPDGSSSQPTSIAIQFDAVSRNLYLVFTKIVGPEGIPDYRTMFVRSTDLGASWEVEQELTGTHSKGAKLVVGLDGELAVVWENYVQRNLIARHSTDFGVSFGPEVEVASILDNVMMPGSWYTEHQRVHPLMRANNSECFQTPAAFSIAVDRSSGPNRGAWYLVTTEHATGTVGPMTGAVEESENNLYYATANPIEVGNDVDGSVVSSESAYDTDVFTFEGEAGQTIWGNGIFFSTPEGAAFGPLIECGDDTTQITWVSCYNIRREGTGPSAIYTLPSTGRYFLRIFPSFLSGVGYRLRLRSYTVDPGSVARDHRDVLLCSSTDGGVTWSPKVRVSDGPVGSDDAFPEVVVDGDGRVHVAWYDRRDATECGARTNTYWAYSDDGGLTFTPGVRVSELESQSGNVADLRWAVGDHLGLAAEGGKVYVLWTRIPQGGGADIWGTVIQDLPTAVLVSGLAAEGIGGTVSLRWWMGDVTGVNEFRVHQAVETSEYEVVGRVAVQGDGEYRWQDDDAAPGQRYRYRLEVVLQNGGSVWEGPVVLTLPAPAVRLAWRGAVPNPFADTVELELESPNRGETRILVYDVTGHKIVELSGERRGEGLVIRWNGRDGRGRVVPPGVYLVRAQLGPSTVVRQVVRMK